MSRSFAGLRKKKLQMKKTESIKKCWREGKKMYQTLNETSFFCRFFFFMRSQFRNKSIVVFEVYNCLPQNQHRKKERFLSDKFRSIRLKKKSARGRRKEWRKRKKIGAWRGASSFEQNNLHQFAQVNVTQRKKTRKVKKKDRVAVAVTRVHQNRNANFEFTCDHTNRNDRLHLFSSISDNGTMHTTRMSKNVNKKKKDMSSDDLEIKRTKSKEKRKREKKTLPQIDQCERISPSKLVVSCIRSTNNEAIHRFQFILLHSIFSCFVDGASKLQFRNKSDFRSKCE